MLPSSKSQQESTHRLQNLRDKFRATKRVIGKSPLSRSQNHGQACLQGNEMQRASFSHSGNSFLNNWTLGCPSLGWLLAPSPPVTRTQARAT